MLNLQRVVRPTTNIIAARAATMMVCFMLACLSRTVAHLLIFVETHASPVRASIESFLRLPSSTNTAIELIRRKSGD